MPATATDYVILRVSGYPITTKAHVGPVGYPGALFTVCDLRENCRELAHFDARGSKTKEIRDKNIEAAQHFAKQYVDKLRWRDQNWGDREVEV